MFNFSYKEKLPNDVGFILTHFVFLHAVLIFTRYTLWDLLYHTSSLRSMSPKSGRDIDHWLRQSSNIITFKTVLRICCRISGCSSSTWRNMSLGVGTPLRVFFPVKITVRYLKKKQHYPNSIIHKYVIKTTLFHSQMAVYVSPFITILL